MAPSPLFERQFAVHLAFQERVFSHLDSQGELLDLQHCRKIARRLFERGASEDVVTAALFHNFRQEHLTRQTQGKLKNLLQERDAVWNKPENREARKKFEGNYEDAKKIVAAYREIVEEPSADVNVKFSLAVEDPDKMKASLLRAEDLVDRLDPSDPQIAEKLEIAEHVYVPWANLLGFVSLSEELGDKIVKIKDPKAYNKINRGLSAYRRKLGKILSFKNALEPNLKREGVNALVELRGGPGSSGLSDLGLKSVYSIYRKLTAYGHPVGDPNYTLDLSAIHDLFGLRIQVLTAGLKETEKKEMLSDALNLVKTACTPSSTALSDDYVSTPKKSGYMAHHVPVLVGSENLPCEIQVMTDEMHRRNEYDTPASHLWYKLRNVNDDLRRTLVLIREARDQGTPIEQLFAGVGRPSMRVRVQSMLAGLNREFAVPAGSTPVDLWYLHGIPQSIQKWARTRKEFFLHGASVSGQPVRLHDRLQHGDSVLFHIGDVPLGPETVRQDLLPHVLTPEAQKGLREDLKKYRR